MTSLLTAQVLIKHRASEESFKLVEKILSCLESRHVYLTWQEHDRITADTQAVTHAAFLSMGAAWAANKQFPWEIPRYVGGIENVKINVMMRIFNNKWHVYAGLAIMNPSARDQIRQYAASVTELFKLMLLGHREEFSRRIKEAAHKVFGASESNHRDLLLDDKILDRFSLGEKPAERVKNSHLSLLAMVDCWAQLGIVPYKHMICSTPVSRTFHNILNSDRDPDLTLESQLFRMWLGITEYLFRTPALLEETINTAMGDDTFRGDDLEFTFAARVRMLLTPAALVLQLTYSRIGANALTFELSRLTRRSLRRFRYTLGHVFRKRSELATK
jgi:prephenate dehydrogenase (NADP+)